MSDKGPSCSVLHDRVLEAAARLQAVSHAGFTVPQLHAELGVCHTVVRNHLKCLADKIRPTGHWTRYRAIVWRMADAGPISDQDLAAAAAKLSPQRIDGKRNLDRTFQALEQIAREHPEGVTIAALVARLGLKYSTAVNHVKKLAKAGRVVAAGYGPPRKGRTGAGYPTLWKPKTPQKVTA